MDLNDPTVLIELLERRMPFGKYGGRAILDLPQGYLQWFAQKGFPPGHLGELMALALEVKHNGLEGLVRAAVRQS